MSVNAFGQASTAKTNSANVDMSAFLKVDGTHAMSGILDMGGKKSQTFKLPLLVEMYAQNLMLIQSF